MNILTRFKDIMTANVNALLDKAEDPEKMVEQCLRNLNNDLGKVKSETAAVMAEEQRAKRELDECKEDIEKMQRFAIKAIEAANDNDAKKFLEKKALLASNEVSLKANYQIASSNASNMKAMHDKLVGDIAQLESRKTIIKGKLAVAKTQEHMNKMTSSVDGASSSITAFDRMEQKANEVLDRANAMAELNKSPADDMKDLEAKYSDTASSAVDDELAALKQNLGK